MIIILLQAIYWIGGITSTLCRLFVNYLKTEEMEGILNFQEPLNVALLDAVVAAFYSTNNAQVSQYNNEVLL